MSLSTFNVFGQDIDTHCGTNAATAALLKKDTALSRRMEVLEEAVQQYISAHSEEIYQRSDSIITVPIVVHVVNNGEPIGCGNNVTDISNINDAQVLSEIGVLNLDYSRQNADTSLTPDVFKVVAADMGIQFSMAVRDPNGRPTNGVDRINGQQSGWEQPDIDGSLKPATIWDWNQYLNIWTVNFSQYTYILGYTIIPLVSNPYIDGEVIGYPYYGNTGNVQYPYNEGRTATHETGHWFGLYHPWGKTQGPYVDTCDGIGAGIPDVPDAQEANFNCPDFPHFSCPGTAHGDMFMNYMDYTNDGCMNIFTQGQAAYAHAIMDTSILPARHNILTSLAATRYQYDAAILSVREPGTQVCTDSLRPVVQISNEGLANLTSRYINYTIDATTNGQTTWTGNLATGQSAFVTLNALKLQPGAHTITFYLTCPNGVQDQFNLNDSLTVSFTVDSGNSIVGQQLPLNEGFEGGVIPSGWTTTQTAVNIDTISWQPTTAAGAVGSSGSVWANNFAGANSLGNRADLILPPIALDPGKYPSVSFYVAYAQRDTSSSDFLSLEYSLDCGNTWYTVYSMGGTCLMTTAPTSSSYVPSSGDWQLQNIPIPEVAGHDNVLLRFEDYSDGGNNIYLDDISINEFFVGIDNILQPSFGVVISPNPSGGKFTATFDQLLPTNTSLKVYDLLGRSIYFNPSISDASTSIDLSGNGAGMYLVQVVSGTSSVVKKLVIR